MLGDGAWAFVLKDETLRLNQPSTGHIGQQHRVSRAGRLRVPDRIFYHLQFLDCTLGEVRHIGISA